MPRVKRGRVRATKRKNLLKKVKGYRWNRKSNVKLAHAATKKAGENAYRGRKEKKRNNRGLWLIKINAGSRKQGISYSKLMGQLKKQNIALDRKTLAILAEKHPEIFSKIVNLVK